MNLLVFDTSNQTCTVGLLKSCEISSLQNTNELKHARILLPMIQTLLRNAHLSLDELDAIAYAAGPGSYTGARLATSVAQGLGFGLHKPLIQFSTLALLAQTVYLEQQWANVLIATDARMEQVYWAMYQSNQQGLMALVGQEQCIAPDQIALPTQHDWCGVGEGWDKYSEKLTTRLSFRPIKLQTSVVPSAVALIDLAKAKYQQNAFVNVSDAAPVYLSV